jgi:hypothetical protein
VQELAEQMIKIQTGIYKPYFLRHKDEDQDDKLDESKDFEAGDQSDNIIRIRSYFPVKLWPNQDTYDLWSNYLNLECIMRDYQALNTLFLSVKLFENSLLIHI